MVNKNIFQNLFIFEMANNHMGDVKLGLRIIKEIRKISKEFNFNFAFKLQYRDLDTFIHGKFKNRKDIKYVKRFTETRLSNEELLTLKAEIKKSGFLSVCTPFDEASVDLTGVHGFDIIKIGSCSFTDWPLLERMVKLDRPIIASVAGVSLEDIDRVVSFFEHRNKQFALMHCVGDYPASTANLQLNQIGLLLNRYAGVQIGYSGHEEPDNYDAIRIAIAKGATIFEKHVGVKTKKYNLNAYSISPNQARLWLKTAEETFKMCGAINAERITTEREISGLRELKRGLFAKRNIKKAEKISVSEVFFAIPNLEGQVLANDFSKYREFIANKDIEADDAVLFGDVTVVDLRNKVIKIINAIKPILLKSKIILSNKLELELSHHYGIEKFEQWGAAIINCINREYCKKLIIMLPGQRHPVHHHSKKEETFHVVYGDVNMNLDSVDNKYAAGEMVTIERLARHGFGSSNGAILEEISTTHYAQDSFYDDEEINSNRARKTQVTFWADWLYKPIK